MSITCKHFTNLLSRIFRVKDIGDGQGNVFFWRYTIFKCRWFSIYLHQFERGDNDRCLHDHPWSFLSIVLKGGYWEEIAPRFTRPYYNGNELAQVLAIRLGFAQMHWRRPGSILWRPAKTAHRITIDPNRKPWSLVIVGRKWRDWGFYEPRGWVPWTPGYSPICETEISSTKGN